MAWKSWRCMWSCNCNWSKAAALGFNKIDSAAALGSIIGRMISPAANCRPWLLQSRTGLGELLIMIMEHQSDALVHHQRYVAQTSSGAGSVSGRSGADLFALNRSIVLYDLTNTILKASVPNQGSIRPLQRKAQWLSIGYLRSWYWMAMVFRWAARSFQQRQWTGHVALMLGGLQGKTHYLGKNR